jgi:hypothetical protein
MDYQIKSTEFFLQIFIIIGKEHKASRTNFFLLPNILLEITLCNEGWDELMITDIIHLSLFINLLIIRSLIN